MASTSTLPGRFVPRMRFFYPNHIQSWHPGHMKGFMDRMSAEVADMDLVIECRDARLPLTSINPRLEEVVNASWGPGWRTGDGFEKGRRRGRLVVYTKRDLAEERFEEPLKAAFQRHANQKIMFAKTQEPEDVKKVLRHCISFAKKYAATILDMKILVVGMPNVGKSSLLNALRHAGLKKGKHFKTGNTSGTTRKFTGTAKISEDPRVYVYDAPGVLVPWFGEGEDAADRAMMVALTSGMHDSLVTDEMIADYLLFRLNLRAAESESLPLGHMERVIPYHFGLPYSEELHESTNDINAFLAALARRIGALRRGGFVDADRSAAFFLHRFRLGKLGRYTLDDLEQKGDLYADPAFLFFPEEVRAAGLEGGGDDDGGRGGRLVETREEIHERKHMDVLLPQPKDKHLALIEDLGLPRSFDPQNPPWAPPYEDSLAHLNLTKYAPPLKTPSDLFEKVDEAVRRYYFGKEEKEGQISRAQALKMALAERKSGQIAQQKTMLLERQRRAGLAQRPVGRIKAS